jgi:hypothetical protein
MKTFVYVDGFNLYYGLSQLCKGRGPWRWLDLETWVRSQSPAAFEIAHVRYFTAHVKPAYWAKAKRQKKFLRALRAKGVTVHKGKYETRESQYPLRDDPSTMVWVLRTEEKQSDVNLASYLLLDALVTKEIEAAIVVSNDSDLVFPVKTLRSEGFPVGILNPHPERPGAELRDIASFYRLAKVSKVLAAQMPEEITDEHGAFHCPPRWVEQPPATSSPA